MTTLTPMSADLNPSPRVAIIGCGLIGQKRLSALPPGSVTVACDLQLDRAKGLAALSSGCEATDSVEHAVQSPKVDAVMVATLNASLAPIAMQAVRAGKHVLVEKPGAISVAESDSLKLPPRRPARWCGWGTIIATTPRA
jgi:predicted dehydrogenase